MVLTPTLDGADFDVVIRRLLFNFLACKLYMVNGGSKRGITWNMIVELCLISFCNNSTKAMIVSLSVSGSTEGSQRSLDPISKSKMSGSTSLITGRSKPNSFSTVRPPFPSSRTAVEFCRSKFWSGTLLFKISFILRRNEWPSINQARPRGRGGGGVVGYQYTLFHSPVIPIYLKYKTINTKYLEIQEKQETLYP